MKIICTQENLKNGLLTVGRIISPNNTLPILNNLLLKTENGLLKISSTNLEVAITTQIRCKIEEEGGATVFSKTFIDLINSLPNTNITINADNKEMSVETDTYHTVLKTLPVEDFPLIPQIENKNQINLPAQTFKKAMDQVVFAVSTNQTQPEIAGVFVSVEKDLKLVATDRYRLAEKKIVLEKDPGFVQAVIMPQKTGQEISRIIGNQEQALEITFNQTQAGFVVGQTQIITRLVDGQYPEYGEIIPQEFKTNILVERKPLVNALKAGSIFSHNTNSVSFSYEQEKLVLNTESADVGKSKVEIPAVVEGDLGGLLLNFHYVLDCLNVVESEKINLKIINSDSPAIMVPEGDNSYIYLVMPIKN